MIRFGLRRRQSPHQTTLADIESQLTLLRAEFKYLDSAKDLSSDVNKVYSAVVRLDHSVRDRLVQYWEGAAQDMIADSTRAFAHCRYIADQNPELLEKVHLNKHNVHELVEALVSLASKRFYDAQRVREENLREIATLRNQVWSLQEQLRLKGGENLGVEWPDAIGEDISKD